MTLDKWPPVDPRPDTQQRFTEHASTEPDHTTAQNTSLSPERIQNKGTTARLPFSCPDCQTTWTEVYLLRYTERTSDGKRFARNSLSSCTCHESTADGNHFVETKRVKQSTDVIACHAKCGHCSQTYRDIYVYQRAD